jgi:hypothetical protein
MGTWILKALKNSGGDDAEETVLKQIRVNVHK